MRLIVPAAAGAAPDVVARLLADKLSAALGQGVVVDNRPGAGGIPGMSALARAGNDGYTIGFVPAAMATVTPLVYKNPQFNPDTDLVPIATVGISPLMLVTNASNNIRTLADLAAFAKANPGKVNFAAPQPNSLPHLAGEMVSKAGDMGLFTVPYPWPPARQDHVWQRLPEPALRTHPARVGRVGLQGCTWRGQCASHPIIGAMKISKGAIAGVLLLEPRVHTDTRGFLYESFNRRALAQATGLDLQFVQDNHSHSQRNVLRGLHYQSVRPQGKLVHVTAGKVFDVAVDIRPGSSTYGKWVGEVLSAANRRQMWLPPGLAHGYLVLSDSADLVYKMTDYYAPEHERCIAWNDPTLAIDWPLNGALPILSAKDAAGGDFLGAAYLLEADVPNSVAGPGRRRVVCGAIDQESGQA